MRPEVYVMILGKFEARSANGGLLEHVPRKVKELFAYLLLHRGRAHARGALAHLLWPEGDPGESRRHFRQALWHLQRELRSAVPETADLIEQEPGWVRLVEDGRLWVDTAQFEAAHGRPGARRADARDAKRLVEAAKLYRGELLQGWDRPWCASERDRFRAMYFTILWRLTNHFESEREYETGIAYAALALECDRANERAHRTLMRLRYLSGDRTGAIRQYEQCRAALREDLDVEPGEETVVLFESIRADTGKIGDPEPSESGGHGREGDGHPPKLADGKVKREA